MVTPTPHLEPKHQLVVFNKKEIIIILLLFVLVALLSFTLGVRMGRSLVDTKLYDESSREAPLSEKHASQGAIGTQEGSAHEDDEASGNVGLLGDGDPENVQAAKDRQAGKATERAEDVADSMLNSELKKTGVKADRPVNMDLPSEKKADTAPAKMTGRFTLQVGSHRTVSEAAEQVSSLKKKGLDAFYMEAILPGRGTWYRVGVGNFSTKEEAELYSARYKNDLPPFIVQKVTE